jgi:hypothetical protein
MSPLLPEVQIEDKVRYITEDSGLSRIRKKSSFGNLEPAWKFGHLGRISWN